MKKLLFCIIGVSMVFPGLTWGQNNSGDHVKYMPRTIETGDISGVQNPYDDIVRYRYNPIENQWKLRPNKCTLKYNPMENQWTYASPGEVLRFNPAENNWDYQSPETRLRYHIIDEKWFYGYSLLKKEQENLGALPSASPLH